MLTVSKKAWDEHEAGQQAKLRRPRPTRRSTLERGEAPDAQEKEAIEFFKKQG